jgi:hypothetical protein
MLNVMVPAFSNRLSEASGRTASRSEFPWQLQKVVDRFAGLEPLAPHLPYTSALRCVRARHRRTNRRQPCRELPASRFASPRASTRVRKGRC